jgi:MarR family transcriptional regulator, lower aerobic nicotinate degradation pathway regulator
MPRRPKSPRSAQTHPAPSAPQPRRLPILLRHAWFSLNQTFRRRLASTGVTPDQFTAMRTLMEHEPQGLTQSGLTRLIASDPNTIASLVERMESMGWITRVRHEVDRRAYRLCLSAAGREQFERVRPIAIALQTEVLAGWTEKKREQFLEDLAYVAEQCRKAAKKVSRKRREGKESTHESHE